MAFDATAGSANANSYIDEAFADLHHSDRGNDRWAALTTPQKEQCLIRATDYIDKRFGQVFRGRKQSSIQALEWPRINAYDDDGFAFSAQDDIPRQLEKATAEYALRAAIYNVLAPDPTRVVPDQDLSQSVERPDPAPGGAVGSSRRKVGPLETETTYKYPGLDGSSGGRSGQSSLVSDFYIPEYPEADMWLEELIRSSASVALVRA